MRAIIVGLCLSVSLFGEHSKLDAPHDSVSAEIGPSSFVNYVNTIYGNIIYPTVDFTMTGPQPLTLIRYYNSLNSHESWLGVGMSTNFPVWVVGRYDDKEDKFPSLISEEDGGTVITCLAHPHAPDHATFYLNPELTHKGLTNTGKSEISGRTNLKNASFEYKILKDHGYWIGGEWTATMSDGTKRYYGGTYEYEGPLNLLGEEMPNGNKIMFRYAHQSDTLGNLRGVMSGSHDGKHSFSFFDVDSHMSQGKKKITTSNDKWAKYEFQHANHGEYLEKCSSSDTPVTTFEYTWTDKQRVISKISRPDGRYLKLKYDDGKVVEQRGPVGKEGKEDTINRFEYHDHHTNVFDAQERKSSYAYTHERRLSSIERYEKEGDDYHLSRGERFFWGKRGHIHRGEHDDEDEGHLMAKSLYDSSSEAVTSTCYKYDKDGNIVKETVYGNLSGTGKATFSQEKDGSPKSSHVECYKTWSEYSHDRFHLLKSRTEDNGLTTTYKYQEHTDLLVEKFTSDKKRILIREFFKYDDDATLIKKIIDDGSSKDQDNLKDVTERRITTVTPLSGYSNRGLPKEITEFYLDLRTGQKVQLLRKAFSYNGKGLVVEEKVFDAHDTLRYTTKTKYDEHSLPTEKIDRIGRKFVFEYDDNFNKIREEQIGSGFYTQFTYDPSNRLTSKTERHSDGNKFTTKYVYDKVGNLIEEIDSFGQSTFYEYDDLNRVKSIQYPSSIDKDGKRSTPTIDKRYNVQDCVTRETDENGEKTSYEYTTRKKPSLIRYPDGSKEAFEYNLDGTLAKKTERNSSYILYTYDVFGRILSEDTYDAKGVHLTNSSNTYSSFHKTASTDPMGYTTFYRYDGAGRLREVTKSSHGRKTKEVYIYDSLGRKQKVQSWFGSGEKEYLSKVEKHDLLDRVRVEVSETADGKPLSRKEYEYDALGNRCKEISYSSETVNSMTKIEYNSRSLPVSIHDALGNVTTISYNYSKINTLGQKVLEKTTTDPMGMKTIEQFDAFGRPDLIQKYSKTNVLLAETLFRYDAKGQKTLQKESVIVNGAIVRDYVIEWTYTAMGDVSSLTEQPGTAQTRKTSYTYTSFGALEQIVKPNGITLTHQYNSLKQLIKLFSSDGTIDYRYAYNLNGLPTSIRDKVQAIDYEKTYDAWSRERSETLMPTIKTSTEYDLLGRTTRFTIDSWPIVEYHYQEGRLASVTRKNTQNNTLYRHEYTSINWEGNVCTSHLIGNAGKASFTYDALGRNRSIVTPTWSETIPENGFDAVGNLTTVSMNDSGGAISSTYRYNDLYQLIAEEGEFASTYEYDSIHNRLKKDMNSYTTGVCNELNATNEVTLQYDQNGNLVLWKEPSREMHLSYDAFDRLMTVELPQKTRLEFVYDAFHRRVAKKVFSWNASSNRWNDPILYRFLFFGKREVGMMGPSGDMLDYRVLGLGKGAELGASIAIELKGTTYCPIHDHRGNITTLIDKDSGTPSEVYRYSAFGEQHALSGGDSPWGFSSKRLDPETGFLFFGRRYYTPPLGRFITPDPVGFADGPNLYAYAQNRPLVLVDPYGTTIEEATAVGAAGAQGLANGITHPIDALNRTTGYLSRANELPEAWHSSRWTEIASFGMERAGELGGAALSLAPYAGMAMMVERTCAYGLSRSGFGSISNSLYTAQAARQEALVAGESSYARMETTAVLERATLAEETSVSGRSSLGTATQTLEKEALAEVEEVGAANKPSQASNSPIWTKGRADTPVANAYDHWKRHGKDFPGIPNAKQYVEKARELRDRKDVLSGIRTSGDQVVFDPLTETFAVYTKIGVPKTMYRPDPLVHKKTNLEYFYDQTNR